MVSVSKTGKIKNDMTEGVIWKSILLFSLPLIAGNLLQQLYNTADSLIVGIFSESPDVVEYGVQCLWALAPFYVLLATIHSLAGAIRGSGHTVPPMVIILISLCLYRIAWMEFVAPLFGSIIGVYITYPTSFFVGATLMIIYTLRGKWLIPKNLKSD